jgi:hypothetical protein
MLTFLCFMFVHAMFLYLLYTSVAIITRTNRLYNAWNENAAPGWLYY